MIIQIAVCVRVAKRIEQPAGSAVNGD